MNYTEASLDALIPKDIQPLVFRFFVIFSRFEYALKRSGFITPAAEPKWDCFATTHKDAFTPGYTPALKAACDYFETHPPQKQVYANEDLSWSPPVLRGSEHQLLWLLCMIRRVRNNLFHGGKYPIEHDLDSARDSILLNHALTILDASLSLDRSVLSHFNSPSQ